MQVVLYKTVVVINKVHRIYGSKNFKKLNNISINCCRLH